MIITKYVIDLESIVGHESLDLLDQHRNNAINSFVKECQKNKESVWTKLVVEQIVLGVSKVGEIHGMIVGGEATSEDLDLLVHILTPTYLVGGDGQRSDEDDKVKMSYLQTLLSRLNI